MTHKSDDYKLTAVQHYLDTDNTQTDTCSIFKCSPRRMYSSDTQRLWRSAQME